MPSDEPRTFPMVEIGVARTPLKERREAPQQPGPVGRSHERQNQAGAEGFIEIHPPYRACLDDLEGFERVWLLYVFHLNQGWKPRVRPPRGGPPRGLFATRGPHRPTSVGLTPARLLEVTPAGIRVGGIDLLDGTPVVDIKPYLPFVDAWPEARMGWLEGALDLARQQEAPDQAPGEGAERAASKETA